MNCALCGWRAACDPHLRNTSRSETLRAASLRTTMPSIMQDPRSQGRGTLRIGASRMTTQLKETDPSEFTQHTMTEQEILAHPEFIQAKDVLEHRSLKPSQAMEISFPRDRWSVESIATYLRCLAPYTKGRGYSMDMYADDKAEYLSFTNMRPDSDSEMEVLSNLTDERIMTLPVEALKHFVQTESEVSPDSEIETDYQFYRGGA